MSEKRVMITDAGNVYQNRLATQKIALMALI